MVVACKVEDGRESRTWLPCSNPRLPGARLGPRVLSWCWKYGRMSGPSVIHHPIWATVALTLGLRPGWRGRRSLGLSLLLRGCWLPAAAVRAAPSAELRCSIVVGDVGEVEEASLRYPAPIVRAPDWRGWLAAYTTPSGEGPCGLGSWFSLLEVCSKIRIPPRNLHRCHVSSLGRA